jgi:hypothetical protein
VLPREQRQTDSVHHDTQFTLDIAAGGLISFRLRSGPADERTHHDSGLHQVAIEVELYVPRISLISYEGVTRAQGLAQRLHNISPRRLRTDAVNQG